MNFTMYRMICKIIDLFCDREMVQPTSNSQYIKGLVKAISSRLNSFFFGFNLINFAICS